MSFNPGPASGDINPMQDHNNTNWRYNSNQVNKEDTTEFVSPSPPKNILKSSSTLKFKLRNSKRILNISN